MPAWPGLTPDARRPDPGAALRPYAATAWRSTAGDPQPAAESLEREALGLVAGVAENLDHLLVVEVLGMPGLVDLLGGEESFAPGGIAGGDPRGSLTTCQVARGG